MQVFGDARVYCKEGYERADFSAAAVGRAVGRTTIATAAAGLFESWQESDLLGCAHDPMKQDPNSSYFRSCRRPLCPLARWSNRTARRPAL